MYEAAETLEDCALRSKKDALDLAKQTKVAQLLGSDRRRSRYFKDGDTDCIGSDKEDVHEENVSVNSIFIRIIYLLIS